MCFLWSIFHVMFFFCGFIIRRSHVFSEKAMSFLPDEVHVVSLPGSGGPQHVFPPQHQNSEALMLQL